MFKGIAYFIKFSFKSSKLYIVFRMLVEIINAVIAIAAIVMPKFIIDELFMKRRLKYIALYMLILLGINFIGGQISNFLRAEAENKKEIIRKDFELYIAEKLMVCDYDRIESPSFYNLREKANNYIGGQWNNFGEVMELAFQIFGKILVLSNIIYIIIKLDFVVLLVFLILITFNSIISSYYKKKSMALQMKDMPPALRRCRYFEEITKNSEYAKEIRINGLVQWVLDKYKHYMNVFCGTTINIHKNNLFVRNFVAITNFIQQGVSYTYLIIKVVIYHLSIGQFTMYLNAINSFNGNVNSLMDNLMNIVQYTTYYEAFNEYVNFPVNTRTGMKTLDISKMEYYEIEFVNVSFKYPGQNNYAIKNISIKLDSKKKVCIVGENGAGKTTFVKLLTRLYDPTEGKILLNGIDIREFKYSEYMKIFSVVFQDFALFAYTLKENIALNESENISDEEVIKVTKDVGIFKNLINLKNGIYTQIYKYFNEDGIEPSGGEEQKIAIARAFIKNSPIVILDEPTAALDPRAEYEIYCNFDKLTNEKTTIYISHRLSSSKLCDRILVFRAGEIIEDGDHSYLMNLKGEYNEMFNNQAKYYNN